MSTLPVLAKAFENDMYEQLVNYVSPNGLISSFQSGFRPGSSMVTAIARVSDNICRNMELNQLMILVLLDFSKAFVSVYRGLFILKLHQSYGFHARAAALVSSYLFPRFQKVACGDDVSSLAQLVAGVPQESSISSLCFSLFINDMTEVLEFSKYHMYADDLQIFRSRPREMLFECISTNASSGLNSTISYHTKVFISSFLNCFKYINVSSFFQCNSSLLDFSQFLIIGRKKIITHPFNNQCR
jgi:hypothetical protein